MRRFLGIGITLFFGAAFGQSTDRFEAADVHVSPRSDNNFNLFMRGPQTRGGRYRQIRTATMVDLISTAYKVDGDQGIWRPKLVGIGPIRCHRQVTGRIDSGHPESNAAGVAGRNDSILVARPDSKPMPTHIF